MRYECIKSPPTKLNVYELAETTTGKQIFLLKIPFETTLVNKKSIHPMKTVDTCQMIKFHIIKTIDHNNQYYEYNQNKALNHLDKLGHCIFRKNCEFQFNHCAERLCCFLHAPI